MSYRIFIEKKAEKEAQKIPAKNRVFIDKAILSFASNPRQRGAKKLTEKEGYRLRVGIYRILYIIDDEGKAVVVYKIKKKSKATYK